MRNKIFLTLLVIFTFGLMNIAAQQTVKTISGGVLNGKALMLVKPAYPAAARAVRAEGAVNVQITIDEEGNVISATAVSGHPLLRSAAVEAARASKFSPTILSGIPVKVTGIVVYNFVAGGNSTGISAGGSWFNTAMALSSLEKMPSLRFFDPNSLNYKIPAEWIAEREQIKRLEEIKNTELETPTSEVPKERVIDEKTTSSGNSSVKIVTMGVRVSPESKVSPEVAAISQSLISSIQGRLAGDELNIWYFNLGINVHKALVNSHSRSNDDRAAAANALRDFLTNVPSQISPETVTTAQKIAAAVEKGIFADGDRAEISELLMKLSRPQ